MMKKRIGILFLCLLLCASVFTGCKVNLPDDPYDPNKDVINPEEQYTITFHGWGDVAERNNYQTIIDDFMDEYPNITVSYTAESAASYPTSLRNRANNLPDVFYVPDTEFMYWASASNRLLDITEAFTAAELSELWPEALDKYYYNRSTGLAGKDNGGSLYGLPKDLGPFPLAYNKTLLNQLVAEKGLTATDLACINKDEPMSWDEFRALLKKLDTSTDDTLYGITHYEIEAAVYSNNADFFNADQTQQKITDPNFTEAIQFIADLALVDKVMPDANSQASTSGYQRFQAGNSVFSFMGPWDLADMWTNTEFEFDVLPVPYGRAEGAVSTAWVGSMSYSVSQKAQREGRAAAAVLFVKYLCYNAEAQRKFYDLGQQVPNVVSMAKDEYINNTEGILTGRQLLPQNRDVFVNIISGEKANMRGKARARYYTYEPNWWQDLQDALDSVWRGTETAEAFSNRYKNSFQAQLTSMIDDYRG